MGYHIQDALPAYRGKTAYRGFSGDCSGFRYYEPTLGRWISRDPIAEEGSYLLRGQKPKAIATLMAAQKREEYLESFLRAIRKSFGLHYYSVMLGRRPNWDSIEEEGFRPGLRSTRNYKKADLSTVRSNARKKNLQEISAGSQEYVAGANNMLNEIDALGLQIEFCMYDPETAEYICENGPPIPPSDMPDPGPYIPPSGAWYGNYCGPGGSGEPMDGLDRACQSHDSCYECVPAAGVGGVLAGGVAARACDAQLCADARNAICTTTRCRIARRTVMAIFCLAQGL
jgi:hypothetical protein